MFLSKDWFEVIRVDYSIASIPPFRINILLFSESIWFDAKITRINFSISRTTRVRVDQSCCHISHNLIA